MSDQFEPTGPQTDPDLQTEILRHGREPSAQVAKLKECLGFFASVIKSGEPWTATCERMYRDALMERDHAKQQELRP